MTWPTVVDAQGWMRKVERRLGLLERRPAGGDGGTGGGSTTLAVADTATLDLTLTGNPTAGYLLKGDVLGNVAGTPLAVTDTATLDLTLTGNQTAGYTVSGSVISIPPALVTVADTATLDMTVTGAGTVASPLVLKGDVLSIPASVVTTADSTTIDFTVSGSGTAASPRSITGSVIAIPPALVTVADTTTVDMTVTGAGTAASPLVVSAAVLPAGRTTLSVTDTATLDLTLTGDQTAGYVLKGDVLSTGGQTTLTVTDTPTLDLTLTGSAATGYGLSGAVLNGVPTGAIVEYGGAGVPTGYLLADGSAVSRTTYSALFTAIGTTFGVGDGSTTFNVPNSPAGQTATGSATTGQVGTAGADLIYTGFTLTLQPGTWELEGGIQGQTNARSVQVASIFNVTTGAEITAARGALTVVEPAPLALGLTTRSLTVVLTAATQYRMMLIRDGGQIPNVPAVAGIPAAWLDARRLPYRTAKAVIKT